MTIDGEALSEPAKIDVSADENGRLIPVPVSTPQKGRISFRAVAAPDEGLRPGTLIVEDLTLTTEPRGDAVDTSDSSDSSDAVDDSRRFNVVVYLIDTLRSDHLGCYGYDKPTSPNIDAFAAEAAVFEHTIAQASYTRASVPSLLTGTGPRTHGVLLARNQLPDTIQNVAEILSRRGYDTAAFITNPVVDKSGIERGVDQFRLETEATVLKNALQWIDDRDSGAPFYLYLHTMEPHAPYAPPDKFQAGFASGVRQPALTPDKRGVLARIHKKLFGVNGEPAISFAGRVWLDALLAGALEVGDHQHTLPALYDAEIAHADERFGGFVRSLKERALYDNTVIVLTSDHGEEFYEHGSWEHSRTLYSEILNIPLIVRFPSAAGGTGTRVKSMAQEIDVMPTLLAILGIPIPEYVEGDNLLPLSGDRSPKQTRVLFSHNGGVWLGDAVVDYPWKYIESQVGRELFDLERDPAERASLTAEKPLLAGYYRSLIRARAASTSNREANSQVEISPEQLKKIRTLGYLE